LNATCDSFSERDNPHNGALWAKSQVAPHRWPPYENPMAKFTLVLGNKNYSSWSLRTWLALRQTGVAFDEIVIPL